MRARQGFSIAPTAHHLGKAAYHPHRRPLADRGFQGVNVVRPKYCIGRSCRVPLSGRNAALPIVVLEMRYCGVEYRCRDRSLRRAAGSGRCVSPVRKGAAPSRIAQLEELGSDAAQCADDRFISDRPTKKGSYSNGSRNIIGCLPRRTPLPASVAHPRQTRKSTACNRRLVGACR